MKNVIPYSKEIIFKSNIGEISSISLEHEEEIVGNTVEGIFKVSGEYKTHEISINKEDFSYDLPFSIELDEDIITSTIVVDIQDFNYSFSKDVLKVNIEFSVIGERKNVEEKTDILEEKELQEEIIEELDENDVRNEVIFNEDVIKKINEISKDNKEEIKEELKEEIEMKKEDDVEMEKNKEDEAEEEKNIEEQEYITYHVHVVKEDENIESICKLYEVSQSIVSEYNELNSIKAGDKLIIPEVQDE